MTIIKQGFSSPANGQLMLLDRAPRALHADPNEPVMEVAAAATPLTPDKV